MSTIMTCPACQYTRKPTDDAPDWECPKCQKAYIKTARQKPGSTPSSDVNRYGSQHSQPSAAEDHHCAPPPRLTTSGYNSSEASMSDKSKTLYIRGTRDPSSKEIFYDNMKHYSWRQVMDFWCSSCDSTLDTSGQSFRSFAFFTKGNEYRWDHVIVCFRTKFVLDLLAKLVIIMSDGRFIVVPRSVGEIDAQFNSREKTNTGGAALEDIYRKFHAAAQIKSIDRPPQVCMKDSPILALSLLLITIAAIYSKTDTSFFTISIGIALTILLAYEIYSLVNLKLLALKLCKLQQHEGSDPAA